MMYLYLKLWGGMTKENPNLDLYTVTVGQKFVLTRSFLFKIHFRRGFATEIRYFLHTKN